MTAAIYQTEDTIRVTATFTDFSGTVADLAAAPSFKVFTPDHTQVGTTGTGTHDTTGVYHYDLKLPAAEGIYYIEWTGTAADGTAVRHAEAIIVKFSSST